MQSRGLDRNWVIKAAAPLEEIAVLSQTLQIHPALSELLTQRGIADAEAANFYFRPKLSYLHDPYLLKDMDRAVDCINETILANEPILVFGDYDVDGACSSALLSDFLNACGVENIIHIPDRIFEGYGPNVEAIRALAQRGARVLVTVDCGTTSHEPFEEAHRLGLDVIVFDHHLAPEHLPRALGMGVALHAENERGARRTGGHERELGAGVVAGRRRGLESNPVEMAGARREPLQLDLARLVGGQIDRRRLRVVHPGARPILQAEGDGRGRDDVGGHQRVGRPSQHERAGELGRGGPSGEEKAGEDRRQAAERAVHGTTPRE